MHIKREVVSVNLGSGGGVNQKIEEELVTLTKVVTICYNRVMDVLEKYSNLLIRQIFYCCNVYTRGLSISASA